MIDAPPSRPAPPVPIDPRIRQRRIEVLRAEGRRRLRLLLVAAGALAAAAGAWGATRSPLLDVDRVLVEGAARTGSRAAVAASGIIPGQQLTDVVPAAAQRRLAALPWVASAEVRKDWPGTVRIVLRERTAAALAPGPNGAKVLVDEHGRVLGVAAPDAGAAVPEIVGPVAAGEPGTTVDERLQPALRVAVAMPAALVERAPTVLVAASGEVELGLRGGRGRVRLGPVADLAEKLRAALTVLERVGDRPVSVLDVRVPSAPVLTADPSTR